MTEKNEERSSSTQTNPSGTVTVEASHSVYLKTHSLTSQSYRVSDSRLLIHHELPKPFNKS